MMSKKGSDFGKSHHNKAYILPVNKQAVYHNYIVEYVLSNVLHVSAYLQIIIKQKLNMP